MLPLDSVLMIISHQASVIANYCLNTWFITEFNLDVWIFKFTVWKGNLEKKQKALLTLLYVKSTGCGWVKGLAQIIQTWLPTAKSIPWCQSSLAGFEMMAVYHSRGCYSRTHCVNQQLMPFQVMTGNTSRSDARSILCPIPAPWKQQLFQPSASSPALAPGLAQCSAEALNPSQ